MKRIFILLAGLFLFMKPISGHSQSFTTSVDTVVATVNGMATPSLTITNTTVSSGLALQWHVIATDFPSSWVDGSYFGICDNNLCRTNNGDTVLWNPTTSAGPTYTSSPYLYNSAGSFNLSLDFRTSALGTHWVTIAVKDPGTGYTKNITFLITKAPTSVATIAGNEDANVQLYPNPARDEVNVVYEGNADLKNIAIYNIIGKVMNVYKVSGNSANMNIENLPSGIYFMKLYNATGNAVMTRKFSKQ